MTLIRGPDIPSRPLPFVMELSAGRSEARTRISLFREDITLPASFFPGFLQGIPLRSRASTARSRRRGDAASSMSCFSLPLRPRNNQSFSSRVILRLLFKISARFFFFRIPSGSSVYVSFEVQHLSIDESSLTPTYQSPGYGVHIKSPIPS